MYTWIRRVVGMCENMRKCEFLIYKNKKKYMRYQAKIKPVYFDIYKYINIFMIEFKQN